MRLYKYISFNTGYWEYPLLTNTLCFSSIQEICNPNDSREFYFTVEHPLYALPWIFNDLEGRFKDYFKTVRVLCVSMSLNKENWKTFCGQGGGVCYEFEFIPASVAGDITHKAVHYGCHKEHCVPAFLFNFTKDRELKRLLMKAKSDTPLTHFENKYFYQHGDLGDGLFKHITEELAFKKPKQLFEKEDEYRFIHTVESESFSPPTKFTLNKEGRAFLTFDQLGLKLSKVYTSNIKKVKSVLKSVVEIKIFKPN